MKVLFIHTANMGDVVSSMGVIRAAADKWGSVDVLVRPVFSGLLAGEAGIREVREGDIQHQVYNLIVDLDSSRASRKLIKKIKAQRKVGRYVNLVRRIKYLSYYNTQVHKRPVDHIVQDYLVVGEAIGLAEIGRPSMAKVQLDSQITQLVEKIRSQDKGVAVLASEASNPIRSLPMSLVEGLIEKLKSLGVAVVLVGLDEVRCRALVEKYPGWVHWQPMKMLGLKTLFSSVKTFYGCDSGPMHLASAMGMEVVALFGPTRPQNYGPPIIEGRFVEKEHPCRPCNQNKPCPYEIRCFNSISAQDVL
ncbi:MAG: glycosyltransferase family 9 protein [Bdellovibrionales bacterium]|nr:glycosyltransferase family 9 protein [Bdellovibrionales bacterium]